jgi:diaminopimelate epimerase
MEQFISGSVRIDIISQCENSFAVIDVRDCGPAEVFKRDLALTALIELEVDSLLLLERGEGGLVRVRVLERDGSESEFCGNGVLALAEFLEVSEIVFDTRVGRVACRRTDSIIYAEMVNSARVEKVRIGDLQGMIVTGAEPHLVIAVEDVEVFELNAAYSKYSQIIAGGINVSAVHVTGDRRGYIRTVERGVNRVTKSCGSAAIAAYLAKLDEYGESVSGCWQFDSIGGSHWVQSKGELLELSSRRSCYRFCGTSEIGPRVREPHVRVES